MAIHHTCDPQIGWTTIANTVFRAGLSQNAGWLLCNLLSLPRDWIVHTNHIRKQLGYGKDRSQAAVNELIGFGFMRRSQIRQRGKFATDYYDVFDVPQPGFPAPVNKAPYLRLIHTQRARKVREEIVPTGYSTLSTTERALYGKLDGSKLSNGEAV
jgi:hypothetical protein